MAENGAEPTGKKKLHVPWVAISFAAILFLLLLGRQAMVLLSDKVLAPDTIGMTLAEATRTLTDLGFAVRDSSLAGEPCDDWRVVAQEPVSVRLDPSAEVTLTVSPPYVALPKVVGLTEDEARRLLEEAGFVTTESVFANCETFPEGVVKDVRNQAGMTLAGATVQLVVSKGPQGMPNLRGVPTEDARIILGRFGVRVNEVFAESDATLPDKVVIRTDPDENATLEEARQTGVSIYINRLKQ